MKKITLLFLSLFSFQIGLCQKTVTDSKVLSAPISDETKTLYLDQQNNFSSFTRNQIAFHSDFSNPADWSIYNDAAGSNDDWVIGTTAPAGSFALGPIASTTAANGFALFDSDLYCSGDQSAYLQTANSFDCSSFSGVIVRFEQFYRKYTDETFVEVSTDGSTWTKFEVNEGLSTNASTANPAAGFVNISSVAANEPTVWIRFYFLSGVANSGDGCDFAWMIDDVIVQKKPENDLEFKKSYFRDYTDSTASVYYTQIPVNHANHDSILFGGLVENIGLNTQTNILLNVEVSGQGNYTGLSTPLLSLPHSHVGRTNVTTEFYPNFGAGDYEVKFYFASDSIDGLNYNDTGRFFFEVTESTFARDIGWIDIGSWYDSTLTNWETAVYYELLVPDRAISITSRFPYLTNGYGMLPGDSLSFYVYHESDLNQPVAKNEFYIYQGESGNEPTTVRIKDDNDEHPLLQPGGYYVSVKMHSKKGVIGSLKKLNSNTPQGIVLSKVDGSGWFEETEFTPFIRLNVQGIQDTCSLYEIVGTSIFNNGTLNFTPSGGFPPYSFQWSASCWGCILEGQENSEDLNNIYPGSYTVQVTDSNGCQSNPLTFVYVSSHETEIHKDKFKLYPNPTDGVFSLHFEGLEAGAYNMHLRNVAGRNIKQVKLSLQGTGQQVFDLSNFENGIYFLDVDSTNGERQTFKLIKN